MNELNGIKNEIYASIQSLLLVLSLAVLLGVMGWLVGGQSFGLMAVGAVVLL